MKKSQPEIIKEIAQELDCGNDCYLNIKTTEIIGIPNFSQISDEDEFKEIFRADLEKINQQKADFIKFEALESFESFKIIERFVGQINDRNLTSELENILKKKRPFQNFKRSIDNSNFRQKWFHFKQDELEKIVEKKLNKQKINTK